MAYVKQHVSIVTNMHALISAFILTILCLPLLCNGLYQDCKQNVRGLKYTGKINITEKGENCLPWNDQYISLYWKLKDSQYPDKSVEEASNYCRNIWNFEKGPWCFTSHYNSSKNYTLAYCGIPICSICNYLNDIYIKNTLNSHVKTSLWDAADVITVGIFPVMMLLGLVLNSLSIAVLTRPALNENSTAFLFIILAVMDTLSLLMGALPEWLRKITGYYLDAYNDITCKIYHYFDYMALSSPAWIILTVTFERYISIAKPHKVKSMCTKKKTGLALFVMLLCLFLLSIPKLISVAFRNFILFDKDEIDFELYVYCGTLSSETNFNDYWFDTIVRSVIPFILMMTGDICILYCFQKSNKMHKDIISDEKIKKEKRALKSVTFMLLTASFTYLFLTLPYSVKLLSYDYVWSIYRSINDYQSAMELWNQCTSCLLLLNNSINFLLYCISGETFKEEFLVMCGCHKRLTAREKVIEQAKKERQERLKDKKTCEEEKNERIIELKENEIHNSGERYPLSDLPEYPVEIIERENCETKLNLPEIEHVVHVAEIHMSELEVQRDEIIDMPENFEIYEDDIFSSPKENQTEPAKDQVKIPKR